MTRCAAAILILLAGPGIAAEPTSVSTTNDPARDCRVVDRSPDGEGIWVDLLCPGVAGYFYLVQQTGGREVVTYGHADGPGMPT